jgi:hypothetical protein
MILLPSASAVITKVDFHDQPSWPFFQYMFSICSVVSLMSVFQPDWKNQGKGPWFCHHGLWCAFSNCVLNEWGATGLLPCVYQNICFLCRIPPPAPHSTCTISCNSYCNCNLLFTGLSVHCLLPIQAISSWRWAVVGTGWENPPANTLRPFLPNAYQQGPMHLDRLWCLRAQET